MSDKEITRSEFYKLTPQEQLDYATSGGKVIDDPFDKGPWCCEELARAIHYKNILVQDRTIYIYGKPDFANDGDGYIDDMTSEIQITFCPFCGTDLKTLPKL